MKTLRMVVMMGLVLGLTASTAQAKVEGEIQFDTEMVSWGFTGGPFAMPLASDPANLLGDSVAGYGFVNSEVALTLSSQRAVSPGPPSLGHVDAFRAGNNNPVPLDPINPEELDGELYQVDSFFDVFFDITVTDVDARPGRDYAGQPDGASMSFLDNGPTDVRSDYDAVFDKDAPNFGLFGPPEADPWLGFIQIEIPLGDDTNGNGEDDKIKFTLGTISAGDTNRTFIQLPDGTVINEFDAGAFLEGTVVDESSDPPFTIGTIDPATGLPNPNAFGGPTTATSTLLNPLAAPPVPEPAGLSLIGLAVFSLKRRRGL